MATHEDTQRIDRFGWRRAITRAIPTSSGLSDESWRSRHRAILVVAALHAVGVPLFAISRGRTLEQALIESAPIAVFALAGTLPFQRRTRAASVTLALMLSSAVLVHLSGGAAEMRLHFFVMVPIVALYQDWIPFGVAVSFVLLHHGVVGTIEPSLVYDDPRAWEQPWRWAAIHAGFIGALSAVSVVGWRINEAVLEKQRHAEDELLDEKRIVETLHGIGTALVSELDIDRVSQLVTDAAVKATGAAFGAFFYNVQDPAGESYMLYSLSGVDRSAFERFPMPRNTKVFGPTFAGTSVVRSDDITHDPRYGQNPPYRGMPPGHLPVRSYLAVPVLARGSSEVLGGLFFGHPALGVFGERDERIVVGIASQAAIAFDNARLYQAEREAHELAEGARARVSMLAEVGRVLVSSLDPAVTIDNLARITVPTFADVCVVDIVRSYGSIERVDVRGAPGLEAMSDGLKPFPPDPANGSHPVVRVLRGADSILADEVDRERIDTTTRAPEHAETVRGMQVTSSIVVPLVGRGEVLGAVTFLTVAASDRKFGSEDLPLAEVVGRRAGMAVENARVYQAEREARAEADRATANLSLLAEAGRLSAIPLDEDVRIQQLARVAVPTLADACLIDVLEEDGSMRRVAAAASGFEAFAEEIVRFAPDPHDEVHPIIKVLRGDGNVLVESIDDNFLDQVTRTPEHRDTASRAVVGSTVIVPLASRGSVYGALTLIDFASSGRRFSADDVPLVEEIGRRAGVAVHNARLYRTERDALAAAEAATARVSLLADASRVLVTSLNVETTLLNVANLTVPMLADRCAIDILDEDGRLRRVATSGADGLENNAKPMAITSTEVSKVAHQVASVIEGEGTQLEGTALDGALNSVTVPLAARGTVVGALTLTMTTSSGRQIPRADVPLAEEIGRRAGIAIENARLYALQRGVAESLQHALLPRDLPTIPGFEVTARYQPGGPDERVGGDWYDLFEISTGELAVVMGDVVGHGIPAASLMAQLRNALRAYAWDGIGPAEVLGRLNQFLYGLEREGMATVSFCLLDPIKATLRVANAGHPPFLRLSAEGEADFVGEGLGPALGAVPFASFHEDVLELGPCDTLVFYTDGLIEDRVSSIDAGLARMRDAAAGSATDIDTLCDNILGACLGDRTAEDDVAVLVLRASRMGTRIALRLPAEPRVLSSVRQTIRRWLREQNVAEDDARDVVLACGEACNNAIEHGAAPLDGSFEIEAIMDGDLNVVVRSTGDWRATRDDGGGRGLPLMEALMDDVLIDRTGEGIEVRMLRRLDRGEAAP